MPPSTGPPETESRSKGSVSSKPSRTVTDVVPSICAAVGRLAAYSADDGYERISSCSVDATTATDGARADAAGSTSSCSLMPPWPPPPVEPSSTGSMRATWSRSAPTSSPSVSLSADASSRRRSFSKAACAGEPSGTASIDVDMARSTRRERLGVSE